MKKSLKGLPDTTKAEKKGSKNFTAAHSPYIRCTRIFYIQIQRVDRSIFQIILNLP